MNHLKGREAFNTALNNKRNDVTNDNPGGFALVGLYYHNIIRTNSTIDITNDFNIPFFDTNEIVGRRGDVVYIDDIPYKIIKTPRNMIFPSHDEEYFEIDLDVNSIIKVYGIFFRLKKKEKGLIHPFLDVDNIYWENLRGNPYVTNEKYVDERYDSNINYSLLDYCKDGFIHYRSRKF